ncbi:MAG: hypothetical protein V2A53_00010 [bacterium]
MFQIQGRDVAAVTGKNGICYPYEEKPMIPILIRGDLTGKWKQEDFLLDTGADGTLLHSDEAVRLGLDINEYDKSEKWSICGIDGVPKPLYKKKILIKIGHFLPIFLTVGFSKGVRPGLRLLGRQGILDRFGIAFNGKDFGIFTKQEI